ncbi:hypothetical protein Peur_051428 [Populus x canadensis]
MMLNKANTFLNLLNFGSDFVKPGHDQYVYRHAIGMHNTLSLTLLCVKFAPRAILILSDVVLKALCWK